MNAASRRILLRTAILFASLAPAGALRAELLEFRAAISSNPSPDLRGSASFTSVEALTGRGPTEPVRAFAGGFFNFEFRLGPQDALFSQNGTDGVLAGLIRDVPGAPWTPDWLLQAASDGGNARINDVAVSVDGRVYVTGTFTSDVSFQLAAGQITFAAQQGQTEGFVAWADPFGNWNGAFPVRDMQPESIALGIEGDIFLTGRPILARRYDPQGGEVWSVPEPQDTISLRHIALPADPRNRRLYVAGSVDSEPAAGAVNEDAFVALLSQDDGGAPRIVLVEGRAGTERPGGLGVGPLSGVRFSFSSDDSPNVVVNGAQLQDLPAIPGRHAHLLFFTSDLELAGDNLLGAAADPNFQSTMETSDLAIDYAGNTHVAVSFRGPFTFEGVTHGGQDDAAVVTVDAAGVPFRFTDTAGTALARGNGVAAPDRDLQLLVGDLQAEQGSSEFFTDINVPAFPEQHAYFAAIEPAPDQDAYILVSRNNDPLDVMQQQITARGGEVYRALELRDEGVIFVAAFLTPELVQSLIDSFVISPDLELVPAATVKSSGWALEALNNAPPSAPYSYTYPETCHPTQLYLIDTAIDNSSGYFDGNPNLSFGVSTLVRATGDPLVSSQFDHGTAMLSMIAGPNHGAAPTLPVTVHNYDIYPDGPTARLTALVEAVGLANSHKPLNHPYDPAVYSIASAATDPTVMNFELEPAIDTAIGSGVRATVIVAAGNTKGLAKDYIPSFLGSKPGVICVGAIDMANNQVPETRGGGAVDIWAPGQNVLAADTSGSPITTSGTSASTAFTTGAALLYLSANPTAGPVDLESALVTTYAQYDTVGSIVHVPASGIPGFTGFADWAAWYLLADPSPAGNGDGDIWTNEEEYVWGLNPLAPDFVGSIMTISYEPSTSTFTFTFPLACHLYQESTLTAHLLRDGSSLIIERSSDLETWTDVTATLTLNEVGHNDRQVTLSFDHVLAGAPCFFRVHVQ